MPPSSSGGGAKGALAKQFAEAMEKLATKLAGQKTASLPAGEQGPPAPVKRTKGENNAVVASSFLDSVTKRTQDFFAGKSNKFTDPYINAIGNNPNDRLGTAAKGFGAVGGSIGQLTSAVGGKEAGGLVESISKMGTAIIEGADKLKNWNSQLEKANFQFAEFSTGMTQVQTGSELRRISLEQSKGESLAASAGRQSESSGRFNQRISSTEVLAGKLQNDISAKFTDVVSTLLTPLDAISTKLNQMYDYITGDEAKVPIQDMEALIAGTDAGKKINDYWAALNRPKRFD